MLVSHAVSLGRGSRLGSRCFCARFGRHSETWADDPQFYSTLVTSEKVFDTAWVEATVVRLDQGAVTSGMWRTVSNLLVGTISQVRKGDAQSHLWMDSGIAQGRVLSTILFSLLVNRLAADTRCCCLGVRLIPASHVRSAWQLHADDVVIVAESAEDLQRGIDAVTSCGRRWRFTCGDLFAATSQH